MAGKRTKKQHYVPRFYLQHFADNDGLVWIYDKQSDGIRAASPENTAVETNFYSVKNEDGEYNDDLEEWLSGVESKAAPIYESLLKGNIPADQDKADFAVFVSSLYTRSPAMFTSFAEMHGAFAQKMGDMAVSSRKRFDEIMDKMEAETGRRGTTTEERDAAFEFARDKSRFTMTVDRKTGLAAMTATDDLTDIFFKMKWIVIESPEQHIVTSDSPVVRITPGRHHPIYGDGGFLNKSTFVTLPLSPTKMLEMHWREQMPNGVYRVKKDRGRLYNRQRAGFAERYIFASKSDYGIAALTKKNRDNKLRLNLRSFGNLAPITVKRKLD